MLQDTGPLDLLVEILAAWILPLPLRIDPRRRRTTGNHECLVMVVVPANGPHILAFKFVHNMITPLGGAQVPSQLLDGESSRRRFDVPDEVNSQLLHQSFRGFR